MTFQTKIRAFAMTACALVFAQVSYAGPISSCANVGSPTLLGTVYQASFTCNLYDTAPTYTIDLTPYMTQSPALLANNVVGAGYIVILNGNPLTISANDTNDAALFNTSLWDTVLYFPGNQDAGAASSALTVDWAGAFPTGSAVQSLDESLYGAGADSGFFVQATGSETVFAADPYHTYNVFAPTATATPEPSTFCLLFSGMLGLGFVVARRMRQPWANQA